MSDVSVSRALWLRSVSESELRRMAKLTDSPDGELARWELDRRKAEREFLHAAIAVWQFIDHHGTIYRQERPEEYDELQELHRTEREAWAKYRRWAIA